MQTYLNVRLTELITARDKWQGIQRDLAEQKRTAEDVLQRLEGALAEVQRALQVPVEEPPPDADRVLN